MSAIPLRTDYDAASVRSLARKASDADQVRRLLAIAAVYDGMSGRDVPAGTVAPHAPGSAVRLR